MINNQILKQIIVDNIEVIRRIPFVERNVLIEDQIPMVFTGIRRCGKSYILYQHMTNLITQGHDWEEFLYVNFEDERLMGFDINDFNMLIESFYALTTKNPILFLDEIQNIEGWEKFARRMADEKRHIYITGSNAEMLSKEIETTLGGRYLAVLIHPYSFVEFLKAKSFNWNKRLLNSTSDKGKFIKLFDEYLRYGGFPETINLVDKRSYLSSIYNKIFLGDIVKRYSISNTKALEIMMKKIAESVCTPISFSRLSNIINSVGVTVGKSTIIQYISYCKESYLINSIENYAAKIVDKLANPKYYFVDTGLLNLFLIDSDTTLLENLIACKLLRKYGQDKVFYYQNGVEVDFYIPSESLAIQVSYSISDYETKAREVKALVKLNEFKSIINNLIVTYDEEDLIQENGLEINVVPAYKWMLED